MKNLTKAMVGAVAAGAMAVSAASPAVARDDGNRIGAGEIIAGALVIGGIAAVVAAASDNDRDSYRYGRDYPYDRAGYARYGMTPRQAVTYCSRAAERHASRHRGRADVTQVRSVKDKRNGFDIKGRIAVQQRGPGWSRPRYDTGNFTCKIRNGRISQLDVKGIRGLR